MASSLLRARRYVLVLKSKPDDVRYPGFVTVRHATALENLRYERLVLNPTYERQRYEFTRVLDGVWRQGGWTVYLDELLYLDRMGLRPSIERLLTQGRSKGISVVLGMQRPVAVTRFALSESAHVLSFGLEGRDAKEIGAATQRWVGDAVTTLRRHEFAWYARPDRLWVGKLDPRRQLLEGDYVRA